MTEWETTTLGEVISRAGGSFKTGPFGTALKASEYTESGVPVISVGEVSPGALVLRRDTPRVSPSVTSRLSEYLLNSGDIVFGRKGAVDRSAWVKPAEEGWFLGSDGIRVRLPSSVDSRFVAYQLQREAVRAWLLQHSGGSTLLSLNQSTLSQVPLSLPPFEEQRAIAEVLSALDDKIAANTKLAETLAELTSAKYIGASDLSVGEVKLSEIVRTQYGVTTSAHNDQGPKFLRVTDINKKPWITWDSTPNCTVNSSELVKYHVEPGDILVARMADPGKAAFIDDGDPVAVFASYLVRLRAIDPEQSLYIYYFLRSTRYREYAEGAMQGSVQMNMNAKVIVATDIPMPSSEVTTEFSRAVGVLRKSIQAALRENRTLAATREALLPLLMSGKLRVKVAEKVLEEAL